MMNRIGNGEAGHLDYARKMEMIKMLINLGLIALIFFTGFIITGTRKSWFTLIAVLGCLPLARYAVNWIVRIPYKSLAIKKVEKYMEMAGEITIVFDHVFTTKERNYDICSMAISDNTICGLSTNPKTVITKAEAYLGKYLKDEGYKKVSLKIYDKEEDYLNRLSEMAEHANYPAEKEEYEKVKGKEARIAHALACISL